MTRRLTAAKLWYIKLYAVIFPETPDNLVGLTVGYMQPRNSMLTNLDSSGKYSCSFMLFAEVAMVISPLGVLDGNDSDQKHVEQN